MSVKKRLRALLPSRSADRRGFILIIIVGMLAVLVVLGLSFVEQGRIEIRGAANDRDQGALEALSETGFQFALRALHDDRNVWADSNTSWDPDKGTGWTSRWGFNPYVDKDTSAGGCRTGSHAGLNNNGPAPNHDVVGDGSKAAYFLDSWRVLFWNEEAKGGEKPFGYGFKFDTDYSPWAQRHATDPAMILDTVQLQPLARARKFQVASGSAATGYARVQVAITPMDGRINLNDVFDPGTLTEPDGWYQTYPNDDNPPYHGNNRPRNTGHQDPNLASPDRRTLEYVLGRRPSYANIQLRGYDWRTRAYDHDDAWNTNKRPHQGHANTLMGNYHSDDGCYNFTKWFEVRGRWDWSTYMLGRLYDMDNELSTMETWNSGSGRSKNSAGKDVSYPLNRYRYNYEAPRYVMWAPTRGMSLRRNYPQSGYSGRRNLTRPDNSTTKEVFQWFMPGRYRNDPDVINEARQSWRVGHRDVLFHGFGFDLKNPMRGGVGGHKYWYFYDWCYQGSGGYGHPWPHSFQRHYLPAVARGRFWSDLMANWYFGGAPGYTNKLGQVWGMPYSNWTHLGSSYDSLGLGTHWMPNTMHVWSVGMWNKGKLSSGEISRGLKGYPGNMPPAKPNASYVNPLPKWDDEFIMANAHFTFNNARTSIRAYGIQEPWGLFGAPPTNGTPGRRYDAVDVNNTSFRVVYGLLTPEKIPSMLSRTVVAPHLHWKARYLDAAYLANPGGSLTNADGPWDMTAMDEFRRYDVTTTGDAGNSTPYNPIQNARPDLDVPAPGDTQEPAKPVHPYPFGLISPADPTKVSMYDPSDPGDQYNYMSPTPYNRSIHRHFERFTAVDLASVVAELDGAAQDPTSAYPPSANTGNPLRIFNKMDFELNDPMTGMPADDVFPDCKYDRSLTSTAGRFNPRRFVCRKDKTVNWPDWFMQRTKRIPRQGPQAVGTNNRDKSVPPFKPNSHNMAGRLYSDPGKTAGAGEEAGYIPGFVDHAGSTDDDAAGVAEMFDDPDGDGDVDFVVRRGSGSAPRPIPHPIHGLPNPDYMLSEPGMVHNFKGIDWGDQFRRYFPLQLFESSDSKVSLKGWRAPYPFEKMVDPTPYRLGVPIPSIEMHPGKEPVAGDPEPYQDWVYPTIPVGKGIHAEGPPNFAATSINRAIIPAVGKDEGWRITRIGRKYQEIIADEIMDYQMNPWWPNPVLHLHGGSAPDQRDIPHNNEESVPLSRKVRPFASPTRLFGDINAKLTWPQKWQSYSDAATTQAGNIQYRVPPYYAYWNRFWCRPAGYSKRDHPDPEDNKIWGQPYNHDPDDGPLNMVENRGMYPQAQQYWGQFRSITKGQQVPDDSLRWTDQIHDFPFNNHEDAMGGEWRYMARMLDFMYESEMRAAPARNHPFKNWADFVAFLGHLVYRPPTDATNRDKIKGVNAWKVCHDIIDARNHEAFRIDGSKIGDDPDSGGSTLADSLQGISGSRNWNKAIVARDGYWPISGNYGEFPTPDGPKHYPAPVNPWTASAEAKFEWMRRIDELRGCDEAGLRIEHHYISERAANDVLVSFSNGQIAPIDFDGDGEATMTRRVDLHHDYGTDWASELRSLFIIPHGYPWHAETGNDPVVKAQSRPGRDYNTNTLEEKYAVKDQNTWIDVPRNQILQGCATIPIKFRSNTFRVTVVVEQTDARYQNVHKVQRFTRWYSRVPDMNSSGDKGSKVHGKYTGKFIQHASRAVSGADPDLSWLGVP